MRILLNIFLTILLMSAIWSCRSSTESVIDYKDTVSIKVDKVSTASTSEDLLSLLVSSHRFDLSGIVIDFFPPDSTKGSARASPKQIRINSASASDSLEQFLASKSKNDSSETVNLVAESSSTNKETSQRKSMVADTPHRVTWLAVVGIAMIVFFAIRCRSPSK